MQKELPKATPEQIIEQIRNFIGSSGHGQWSFQISCKLCRDLGTISTNASSIKSQKKKVKASISFSKQGWRADGHELVCPKCYQMYLKKP